MSCGLWWMKPARCIVESSPLIGSCSMQKANWETWMSRGKVTVTPQPWSPRLLGSMGQKPKSQSLQRLKLISYKLSSALRCFYSYTEFFKMWITVQHFKILLQEEDSFWGKRGSLSNTQKWISEETHILTQQEALLRRGAWVESNRLREPRENSSATWLTVLSFMANHSNTGSFLVAHALLSPDGFHWGGFWEIGRTHGLVSSLLLTFPEFCWFVVAC